MKLGPVLHAETASTDSSEQGGADNAGPGHGGASVPAAPFNARLDAGGWPADGALMMKDALMRTAPVF